MLDISGCAHLFGGEEALAARVAAEAAGLGLSLRLGLADTLGAAWAVARFAGAGTRASAWGRCHRPGGARHPVPRQKRSWERGGAPPLARARAGPRSCRRVKPATGSVPLPVAALRLDEGEISR